MVRLRFATSWAALCLIAACGVQQPEAPKPPAPSSEVEGDKPLPATSLEAVAGDARVALTWHKAHLAESYQVLRGTVEGEHGESLAAVSGTTFVDASVTNGTTYYYVVRAANRAGVAEDSNEVAATPAAAAVPVLDAPAGLTAVPGDGAVELSWNAVPGATGYLIFQGDSAAGPFDAGTASVSETYRADGLANGQTYFFTVQAINVTQLSALSNVVSAQPLSGVPDGLQALAASAGPESITLTWGAAAGADSYEVHVAQQASGPFSLVASVAATTYTHAQLIAGLAYSYQVIAVAGDERQPSAVVSATALFPSLELLATGGNARTTLTWNAVASASGYVVRRASASEGPFTAIASISAATYVDEGLANGTPAYYDVQAWTSLGAFSARSNVATATPLAAPAAAVQAGDAFLSVSWQAVAGATAYRVARAHAADSEYTDLETTPSLAFNDSNVTPGVSYTYRIEARNANGASGLGAAA